MKLFEDIESCKTLQTELNIVHMYYFINNTMNFEPLWHSSRLRLP